MTNTDYGFTWGPAAIERSMEFRGSRVLTITTDDRQLEVVVSPKGKTIRAWLDGVPLVPLGSQ